MGWRSQRPVCMPHWHLACETCHRHWCTWPLSRRRLSICPGAAHWQRAWTFFQEACRHLSLKLSCLFEWEVANALDTPTLPNTALFLDQSGRSMFLVPRSGEPRTQKLKSHLVRTQSLNILPLKPGVGRYITIHATLTARDFFLAYFYPSGPFTCIFSKTSHNFSCVGCGKDMVPV